jgi:hypothetical protein
MIVSLALPFAASTALADGGINTKPLLKESVAGNAGLELVMPSIVETVNQNEYPTKITTKFKVYAAGTTNKLFTTPQRKFTPPAHPCASPVWDDWDWDVTFIGEDNSHTGMAINFYVECETAGGQFKEASATYLYMADTSQAGSAWAEQYSRNLISVNLLDWDDDQQDEVHLIVSNEDDTTETAKVIFLDKLTGDQESSKSYAIVNVVLPF